MVIQSVVPSRVVILFPHVPVDPLDVGDLEVWLRKAHEHEGVHRPRVDTTSQRQHPETDVWLGGHVAEVLELCRHDLRATDDAPDSGLGVNQFFCALVNYARGHPGCELAQWLPERAATDACGEMVRPDGYGHWRQDGGSLRFWLEYDTGTETLPRLVEKINTDYRYLSRRLAYPVLFWLPSRARETNLHTALARIEVHPVTVATTTSDVEPVHPADPVWWACGRQERVRLIDIPPTPY